MYINLVGIIVLLYVLYCLKVPQQEGFNNRVKRRLRRAAKKAKEAARKAKEKAKRAAVKVAEEAKRAAAKAAEALRIDKAITSLFKGVIDAQKSIFNVSKLLN